MYVNALPACKFGARGIYEVENAFCTPFALSLHLCWYLWCPLEWGSALAKGRTSVCGSSCPTEPCGRIQQLRAEQRGPEGLLLLLRLGDAAGAGMCEEAGAEMV